MISHIASWDMQKKKKKSLHFKINEKQWNCSTVAVYK
jgi:hypothetical protein